MNEIKSGTFDGKLIAVALNDNGEIFPQAGRANIWRFYILDSNLFTIAWELQLSQLGTLHEWHIRGDGNRHPVHSADIAVAGNAGKGVIENLNQRDTHLITTTESNPDKALALLVEGKLSATPTIQKEGCFDPEKRDQRNRS